MSDQKPMWTRCVGGFSVMWVTKLLISPVKIRIFCPKKSKFGPKMAFLFILGKASPAHLVGWLWCAGCISQGTYLLYNWNLSYSRIFPNNRRKSINQIFISVWHFLHMLSNAQPKTNVNKVPRWVFRMWVTKLLISSVKIRIFCPKKSKFGPKMAFLFILGQALLAHLVGGCGAGAVSRKTPIYFIQPEGPARWER